MTANPQTPETTEIDLPQIDLEKIKSGEAFKDLSNVETVLFDLSVDWGIRLIAAIVILIAGWTIGNWIDRRFDMMRRLDGTLKNFLGGFFKYLIIMVSIITVIGLFGIPMASLLAVLGAAGLAIGLALQGTLANVASGVMLLILRPFNVGDYIEFGQEGGTVKTLGLFGTELAKGDNVYLFAPNSKIWGNEIRNYSRNQIRMQDIKISIGYHEDINKAMDIIRRLLTEEERVLKEPEGKEPKVITDRLNDFSIDLIARFWSNTSDYWSLRWDMNKRLTETLATEGFTLALTPRQMAIEDRTAQR
jgi:small conductance mechanosensitive channel